MEVKTQVTQEDLIQFELSKELRYSRTRRNLQMGAAGWSLGIAFGVAILAALFSPSTFLRVRTLFLPLATLPITALLFYRLSKWRIEKKVRQGLAVKRIQGLLGDYFISFNEDGITVTRNEGPYFRGWEQIKAVVSDHSYGNFFISHVEAIIVPQRCFSDESSFQSFMKFAVIYHWNKGRAIAEQKKSHSHTPTELPPPSATIAFSSK